jgi:hypothetical protein
MISCRAGALAPNGMASRSTPLGAGRQRRDRQDAFSFSRHFWKGAAAASGVATLYHRRGQPLPAPVLLGSAGDGVGRAT